jgi:hypothetical protein
MTRTPARPNQIGPRGTVYRPSLPSSISCKRIGDLSTDRLISRTSQGAGLRNNMRPSLSSPTSIKPLGRNAILRGEAPAGSVSVKTITSRSASASMRDLSKSICNRNCGSFALSAKTTKGRASQRKSARFSSVTLKIWAGSSAHWAEMLGSGSAPVSCAMTNTAEKQEIKSARPRCFNTVIPLDIGRNFSYPKGQLGAMRKNFNLNPVVRKVRA